MVAKVFGYLFELVLILVSNDIGQTFLPGAAWKLSQVGGSDLFNDIGEVVLGDGLDHLLDEDVLVLREVFSLDLFVEVFATSFSDEKSLGGSSALESNLSSVLELTNKKALLDGALSCLIPVHVSGDGLLNHLGLARACSSSTASFVIH